jgi:hypothetical protein
VISTRLRPGPDQQKKTVLNGMLAALQKNIGGAQHLFAAIQRRGQIEARPKNCGFISVAARGCVPALAFSLARGP